MYGVERYPHRCAFSTFFCICIGNYQRYLQQSRGFIRRSDTQIHCISVSYLDNKNVTNDVSCVCGEEAWGTGLGGAHSNYSALPSPPRYPTPYDNAYPNTTTGAMAAPSIESHNNALVSRPPGPEYQLSVGEGMSPQPPPKPALARSPILGRITCHIIFILLQLKKLRHLCPSRRNPPRHTLTAPFRHTDH